MDLKTVFRLQIIVLLDSVCFGLIYAFINPYLIIIGGNNFIVGIFTVLNLICQLIAPDITKILTGQAGKQFSLFLVSIIATISYLLITLTDSYWFIIISRCIFTITNQTNSICREILLKKIPKDETEYFLEMHNVLSSVGFIVGPIITGCLFSHGFAYSCFLAAILTFGNVWMTTTLTIEDQDDEDKESKDEKSLLVKAGERVADVVKNFQESDFIQNWDLITLKFLFASSVLVFFSKFTFLMKYNYNADALVIGTTGAYMNALVFACTYILDNFREDAKFSHMQNALITLLMSLTFACYAPFFVSYLLICIPLILCRCYLNSNWVTLFALRKNQALSNVNESIGIIAGLTTPIAFGIVCDLIEHHAVVWFTVFPIFFSLFIFSQHTKWRISEQVDNTQENVKDKDE